MTSFNRRYVKIKDTSSSAFAGHIGFAEDFTVKGNAYYYRVRLWNGKRVSIAKTSLLMSSKEAFDKVCTDNNTAGPEQFYLLIQSSADSVVIGPISLKDAKQQATERKNINPSWSCVITRAILEAEDPQVVVNFKKV